MKTTRLIALAAIMSTAIQAESGERTVPVCFNRANAGETADKAQMIASKMFHEIGVKLQWHDAGHFCQTHQNQVIAISLSNQTPGTLLPGALAYALPYEGVHIEVFYDRMVTVTGVDEVLLAHVLVHEITHILQGVNRHSASGIMMAHWDSDHYTHMRIQHLTFTAEDTKLIHEGLAARAAQATLAAR